LASSVNDTLRRQIAERAGLRCEYCLIHEDDAGYAHQVDHVLSRKHGGGSEPENLALACVLCNRHKGADVASIDAATGDAVRLFDPRRDQWKDHFRIRSGVFQARTSIGRTTIRILRLNATERIAERLELRR
jgi:5-methylcytosine-specific restriction endonuclease McrA